MATMAQAIREYVESKGESVTSAQIKHHINTKYADQWTARTLQAHLYACAVNNPKAYIHHKSADRFLYKNSDGTFEMYSEADHGPNEWAPISDDNDAENVDDLLETSIGLERDLEDHLVKHLDLIESGLVLIGRQVTIDVGRIDILAEDSNGSRVVIEVKVGDAKDAAIGQIARYLGWYTKIEEKPPRGILIAADFPDPVRYAAAAIANLTLVSYRVNFVFEQISEASISVTD